MKKQIHVKEYTRKKHGRAKFGGKVSSHNKGRARVHSVTAWKYHDKGGEVSRNFLIRFLNETWNTDFPSRPSETDYPIADGWQWRTETFFVHIDHYEGE